MRSLRIRAERAPHQEMGGPACPRAWRSGPGGWPAQSIKMSVNHGSTVPPDPAHFSELEASVEAVDRVQVAVVSTGRLGLRVLVALVDDEFSALDLLQDLQKERERESVRLRDQLQGLRR